MKLITAIIRHEKIEEVKEALTKIKVMGMTVREVRGHGRQKGHKAVYHGAEYSLTLLPKAMLETVVPDEIADSRNDDHRHGTHREKLAMGAYSSIRSNKVTTFDTGERDVT